MGNTFRIADETGRVILEVVISDDDIREARLSDDYSDRWTDADVAVDIYEQRYESALNNAGISYDEAVARGFHIV